jgi:hypothetical protein
MLYKYRTIELAKKILETGMLRASNFSKLNDPFDLTIDSLFPPSFGQSPQEIVDTFTAVLLESGPVYESKNLSTKLAAIQSGLKKSSSENIESLKNELLKTDSFEALKNHLSISSTALDIFKYSFETDGIVCFSKRPNINPLWAHYADNHTGVVLGFRPNKSKDSCFILAQEVLYQDERPMMARNIKEYYKRSFFYSDIDNAREYVDKVHYSKCKSWEYEEELRLILPLHIDPTIGYRDILFHSNELEEIYFGYRTDDKYFQIIREMASRINPNVKFYRMVPDKYSYGLIKQEI